ncbi:hypothetical protein IFM89_000276 [Coptis chinensis]|uniref:Uncharacterized protein n=1 Tax=Coptis chinensis TaxID=261450 RepID=A0A835LH47_9MAGN|nr:hypothetical protein IFM89_000276 [Coptis chinensis]
MEHASLIHWLILLLQDQVLGCAIKVQCLRLYHDFLSNLVGHHQVLSKFLASMMDSLLEIRKLNLMRMDKQLEMIQIAIPKALGGTAKTHCPIFYESFKDVPSPTKRLIWKKIKDEYGIAEVYKKCQLKKFAKSWREYKHRFRVKHYDKYDNDDERKRHCPKGVKRED